MPSFDVVSEVDKVEIKNAVDNANRVLSTRFDFRGVDAEFELAELTVSLRAEAEFQLNQMEDMLRETLSKRGVDPAAIDADKEIEHSGKQFRKEIGFKQGIEQAVAKQMIKKLKAAKLKVQASIQGDKLRVTGKKRDDLQQAIALLKAEDVGQPLQFENFRD